MYVSTNHSLIHCKTSAFHISLNMPVDNSQSLLKSKISGNSVFRIPQRITINVCGSYKCKIKITELIYIFKQTTKIGVQILQGFPGLEITCLVGLQNRSQNFTNWPRKIFTNFLKQVFPKAIFSRRYPKIRREFSVNLADKSFENFVKENFANYFFKFSQSFIFEFFQKNDM